MMYLPFVADQLFLLSQRDRQHSGNNCICDQDTRSALTITALQPGSSQGTSKARACTQLIVLRRLVDVGRQCPAAS